MTLKEVEDKGRERRKEKGLEGIGMRGEGRAGGGQGGTRLLSGQLPLSGELGTYKKPAPAPSPALTSNTKQTRTPVADCRACEVHICLGLPSSPQSHGPHHYWGKILPFTLPQQLSHSCPRQERGLTLSSGSRLQLAVSAALKGKHVPPRRPSASGQFGLLRALGA